MVNNMFFNDIHTRIRLLLLIVIIILLLIIGKVFYIQVFSYNKLSKITEDLWSRKMTINAPRGDIIDRNGKILASSSVTTTIYVVPNQIKDKEEVSKNIASILECDYEDVYKYVSKNSSMEIIRKGMDLESDIADKIDKLGYDGVYLVMDSKRYYPYKDALSHIIGFVGSDNQGLSGLEFTYDKYLKGINGELKYYSDGKGNKLEIPDSYVAPSKGMTLQLTLDIDLIMALDNELNNAISKYNSDHALAIIMNPNTGEILGMGSKPSFDPSNYKNYSEDIINRNLPIWMTYEPGSTFKIITLASSIEEKTVDLFKDTYTDTGSINVDGSILHCWKHGGHGQETYLEVVENSCNPGFVSLGNKLGKEKLMKYIKNFGFGEKTGIDLNGEGNGILFKESNMGPVELATTSFGQGISVTPIQQIAAVSASINGGNLYKPYIVSSIIDDNSKSVIYENNPLIKRKVISDESSALVRYALESVVSNGTGRNAYIENYRVGGKTGTAQKVNNGKYMHGNYILSFIGFLPADNPEVIVYVAVDNPKGVTQYGGTVSAPIARSLLMSSINILGIEEKDGGMLKEYSYLDTKYLIVPDVVGMSKEEATKMLKEFKVKYSGSGNNVIYMSPKGNTFQSVDTTITLMLN